MTRTRKQPLTYADAKRIGGTIAALGVGAYSRPAVEQFAGLAKELGLSAKVEEPHTFRADPKRPHFMDGKTVYVCDVEGDTQAVRKLLEAKLPEFVADWESGQAAGVREDQKVWWVRKRPQGKSLTEQKHDAKRDDADDV